MERGDKLNVAGIIIERAQIDYDGQVTIRINNGPWIVVVRDGDVPVFPREFINFGGPLTGVDKEEVVGLEIYIDQYDLKDVRDTTVFDTVRFEDCTEISEEAMNGAVANCKEKFRRFQENKPADWLEDIEFQRISVTGEQDYFLRGAK